MKRHSFPLVATAVVTITLALGWGIGTWRKPPPASPAPSAVADRGPMVYQVYCATCHGPDGHGDGSSAAALKPPPRDLASRPWRFEPTPDSIRRTTTDGIPGTGMASFAAALSPGDLDAVVAHVHRLATTGPVIEKPWTDEERLLADAGFASRLGSAPPPLTLIDAKGNTFGLSNFAGQLVALHFWGTGCTHCLKEMPILNGVETRFAGRMKVLHVCTDEDDPAVAQRVLDRTVPGTPAFVVSSGLGLARYEVQALPTVWLIAPDGTAIGRSTGAKDWTAETQLKLLAHWLPDKE